MNVPQAQAHRLLTHVLNARELEFLNTQSEFTEAILGITTSSQAFDAFELAVDMINARKDHGPFRKSESPDVGL
jgi:hypothetical protein